ncbi:hypothetical protein ES703_39387 [subsurface metagenome]
MGDYELPVFIVIIASAVLIIGVMVAMAAVTWVFLLMS